jgi:hypothetical protein
MLVTSPRSWSYSHRFSLLLAVCFLSLKYAYLSCFIICTMFSGLINRKQVTSPHIVFNIYTLRCLHIVSFHFTKMAIFICHDVHTAHFTVRQSKDSALNNQNFVLPCCCSLCFSHLQHDESHMLPITHTPTMKHCKCYKEKMCVLKPTGIIYLNAVVSTCRFPIQLTVYSEWSTTLLLSFSYPYTKINFPSLKH